MNDYEETTSNCMVCGGKVWFEGGDASTLLVIQELVRQATGKANWLYSSHRRKEIIEHLHGLLRIVSASLREAKEQENTDG